MTEQEKSAEQPGGDTKECPVCGETIKAKAIKCRFCGEDLEAYAAKREAQVEQVVFEGHPAAFYSLGQYALAVITIGIAAVVYWIKSRMKRFTITNQRIRIERGLLSKTVENIELFRMDDFHLDKPLAMRLLGYGVLQVKSSDRSVNNVVLYGMKNLDSICEQIRRSSFKERERLGIKVWAKT